MSLPVLNKVAGRPSVSLCSTSVFWLLVHRSHLVRILAELPSKCCKCSACTTVTRSEQMVHGTPLVSRMMALSGVMAGSSCGDCLVNLVLCSLDSTCWSYRAGLGLPSMNSDQMFRKSKNKLFKSF